MADAEKTLVVTLNDGVTEGVADEVAGGVITKSVNTRLTRIKGVPTRRPAINQAGASQGQCSALIPGGNASVAAYVRGKVTSRIVDANTTPVTGAVTGTAGQNAYHPYPLIDSGAIGGGLLQAPAATCFDSQGRQWFIVTRQIAPTQWATVLSCNGVTDILAPRVIFTKSYTPTTGNQQFWAGIVPYADGVAAFWQESGGVSVPKGVSAQLFTISGTTLVAGVAAASIYVPTSEASPFVRYDLTADESGNAYLFLRNGSVATTSTVVRIQLASLVTTGTLNIPSTLGTSLSAFALTYFSGVLLFAVSTALAGPTSITHGVIALGTSMSVSWSQQLASAAGVTGGQQVCAQPWVSGGVARAIFGFTQVGTNQTTDPSFTLFMCHPLGGGVSVGTPFVYWYNLQSHGAHWTDPATGDVYPYFPLVATYGGSDLPSQPGGAPTLYMDTPSIEVVTFFSAVLPTPVMRCGVDSVSTWSSFFFASSNCSVSTDGRMSVSYLATRFDQPPVGDSLLSDICTGRYATFDLASTVQPGYAVDATNAAAIAAGLVAVWDGQETTEYSPFHRPRAFPEVTSSGSGSSLTGTFQVSAVVSFRDRYGNVRRSAPALPYPITLTAQKLQVSVTVPLSMRSGVTQEAYDITLYMTAANGAVFYATEADTIAIPQPFGAPNRVFGSIQTPRPGAPQLYTQFVGVQPLENISPPPAWDVLSIGGRFWFIDAENRYRLIPSLLKQTGIAVEFNPTYEITGFDPQYGKLVAIAAVNGSPVVFAERGIWQIDGYGPDNSGQNGTFTEPRLIANAGCRARETVCQVPGVGVIFQTSDGRFALLAGGLKRFETFGAYAVNAPTVHWFFNEVIYPLTDGSGFVVYNWVADAWTHWSKTALPGGPIATLKTDGLSRTYLISYAAGTTSFLYMDSTSSDSSTDQPVSVTRGWIVPESPQGDCVIREVWLHARNAGRHDLTVTVSLDYEDDTTIQRVWTADETDALTTPDGKYTVAVMMQSPVRAVKVNVSAVSVANELHPIPASEICQPLTLTITYGVSAGIRARTLQANAKK